MLDELVKSPTSSVAQGAGAVSMENMPDKVTLDEFKIFYGIDRQLYTVLVKQLWRNPVESLQIMGLWLWIERLGICTVISRIQNIKMMPLINALAEEALAILKFMNDGTLPASKFIAEIPLTRCLLRRCLNLEFFYTNRETIIKEVRCLITDVYIPALSDLVDAARRDFAECSTKAVARCVCLAPQMCANSSALASRQFLSPAPTPVTVPIPSAPYEDQLATNFLGLNIQGGSTTPRQKARPDACEYTRTMFATFSKGYPVTENEVKAFFTAHFGNCIESLHMQEVCDGQQPLFARVVFVDSSYLHAILGGGAKAKFAINGKHVWMRRFVPRSGRHMHRSARD